MTHKDLLFLIVLLITTSCSRENARIEINKNKPGGFFESSLTGKSLDFYNKDESMKLDTTTFIPFAYQEEIKRVKPPYERVFVLDFKLNNTGAIKFKEITNRNLGKQIYLVLGDKIIAAPVITQEIPDGRIQMTIADKTEMEAILEYFRN